MLKPVAAPLVPRVPQEDIVVGRNPVMEALRAGRVRRVWVSATADDDKVMQNLLIQARAVAVPVDRVPPRALDERSDGTAHQGVLAFCEMREAATLQDALDRARGRGEEPFLILLDHVEDPHNLGAVLRVADGVGAHAVVVPDRGAVGLTPSVAKASAGAAEHVLLVTVGNLTDAVIWLKKHDIWVGAAEAEHGRPHYEERLTGPLAIVMGSEGKGVSRPVLKHADFKLHIPLAGHVNSLNVSVATAIIAYERVRQSAQSRQQVK